MPRTKSCLVAVTDMYSPRKGTIRGAAAPPTSSPRPVGLQAATDDQPVDGVPLGAGDDVDPAEAAIDTGDGGREQHPAAGGLDLLGDPLGDRDEVGDRGVWRVQGSHAGGVWLDLADARPLDAAQPRYVVLASGLLERVEPGDLVRVHGDHELAALVVGQPLLGAVVLDQLRPRVHSWAFRLPGL